MVGTTRGWALAWALGLTGFVLGFYHWVFEADLTARAGEMTQAELADRIGVTRQTIIAIEQARAVEQAPPGWVVADTTPLMTAVYSHMLFDDDSLYPMALAHQALYDTTLITGLDLAWVADGLQRDGPHVRGPVDTLVRQALDRAGIAYRVVYGQGHQRLNNALLALGLSGEDESARVTRENAQFAINDGRTVWQCNECSDPECEHKLFTGLLTQRST